ncbi:cell wall hydrolase [Devosia rhizoryzae]|uniref:Cell wall hydrolase n=1 Tax=Devosia rhizoryzae TaxID=2774137 RepID=A0ABX7C5U0_9HYPH|nr:cell wall hydrolase [Devosia rhizoryzae]QQR38112.1 cell wall hydrolase [Devosia rhizoryzae]
MALSHRPVPSRPVRAVSWRLLAVRTLTASVAVSLAYLGLASGAFGPGSDSAAVAKLTAEPVVAKATINFSGAAPTINGSVDHLFASASFTGPNRAEKTDRIRPAADPLAISRSFSEIRTKLAALRGPADPAVFGQSGFAAADGQAEEGPRMSSAALHPGAAAALDAIAGIAPTTGSITSDVTMPQSMPEQLAYARATAPATVFELQGEPMANLSDKEMWCLATAIYFEARGETYRGQVAVAQVVLNRVKDHRYPNTICGVVFQNQNKRNACQFSFACDGIPEAVTERGPWAQAEEIAQKVTSGELYLTEVGEATHYHATYVSPPWARRMTKVTQVGLHVFYKFKTGWLFG